MKKPKKKKPTGKLRLRLPEKVGGPHSSKHGEHGYCRHRAKRELRELDHRSGSFFVSIILIDGIK